MATAIPRWKTDCAKVLQCQEDRDEELKSPPTRYAKEKDGCAIIGKNIPMFQFINEMRTKFDPSRLDEGTGVEETLGANEAKCHQSCRGGPQQHKAGTSLKKSSQVAAENQKAVPSCEEPALIANVPFAFSVNKSLHHLSLDT